MRSGTWLCALVITSACGRIGFDPGAGGDAGADAPLMLDAPPSLCGGGTLVCDGFEGDALAPRWLFDLEQGTASIDTTRAYRGGSSLFVQTDQISTPTVYPRASVQSFDALPITGTVYARAFIYLPAPAAATFDQLVNFSNGAGEGVSVGIRNGKVVSNDYASGQFVESVQDFPVDRWTCIQMSIPSDTVGTIRIAVDDVEVSDAAIPTGATPHPRPSHVYLGIDWPNMYTSLPPSSAWIDELIIDDAPITCDQ